MDQLAASSARRHRMKQCENIATLASHNMYQFCAEIILSRKIICRNVFDCDAFHAVRSSLSGARQKIGEFATQANTQKSFCPVGKHAVARLKRYVGMNARDRNSDFSEGKWVSARIHLRGCWSRNPAVSCSGRQMRNGFLGINLILWALILLAFSLFI